MGNLHLVTGYAGRTHVTAADMGSLFEALIRSGQFVMATGSNFAAAVVTNNQIRISDGELLMQGRHVKLDLGTYVDVVIENGEQGLLRHDLIVARYTRNAETGIEDCNLVVIKGASVEVDPADPECITDSINAGGAALHDMPLYRVVLSGLNVESLQPLFEAQPSVFDVLLPHTGNKNNPHGITPAQIGAVSKTGDIMSGDLHVQKGIPAVRLDSGVGTAALFKNTAGTNDFGTTLEDVRTDGRKVQLSLNADKNGAEALSFYSSADNASYKVLHTGNKHYITPAEIGAAPLDYARSIGLPYLSAAADTATVTASNVDSVTAQGIYYTEMDSWCQTIVFNAGFGAMQMQFSWNGNIRTRINWGGNWSSWN